MLATSKSNSICPFTLKSIAQIKHEDLAVIYETTNLLLTTDQSSDDAGEVECGHSCMLANLVSYLHDNGGGAKLCPVCQLSPASVICDFPSSDFLTRTHGSDGYGCRIISFRYGTITYFLWVQSPPRSSSSSYEKIFRGRNVNAFDRICSVLGIDVKSGLKVIHKGKVIHPVTGKNASKNNNFDDLSEQLLDITAADLIRRRKKPSLVVMGLRKQTTSVRYRSTLSILFSIARQLSPSYLLNVMTSGVRWTFYAVSTLARGMFLFFRSVLYPPQPHI